MLQASTGYWRSSNPFLNKKALGREAFRLPDYLCHLNQRHIEMFSAKQYREALLVLSLVVDNYRRIKEVMRLRFSL